MIKQGNQDELAKRDRTDTVFLQRVRIRNYRSIGKCDLHLKPMTFLVGRNGAGKSNFLDALAFVSDGLDTSVDHAIKSRGGMDAVRRRSTGHPLNFEIKLDFSLPDFWQGHYSFEVAARHNGGFVVRSEYLTMTRSGENRFYKVQEGKVTDSSEQTLPDGVNDRLFLVAASGIQAFRPAYDALRAIGFYSLNPEEMKELQSPDSGELLHRDGANIASVIGRLDAEDEAQKERIQEYLKKIASGVTSFSRRSLGPKETLEFRQDVKGAQHPWRFLAGSMSDGTLRALGILVAVSQYANSRSRVRLVGIEEPETALHPAAAFALVDALREAADQTQVIVTTHSPELLDKVGNEPDAILCVVAEQGKTLISKIDPASRTAISDHLYTAGELLRLDQIEVDRADIDRQGRLFNSSIGGPV